jgi:NAD(P)H dehydrogenase (quinone)
MKHLIVYSHPNPASFNHKIKEKYIETLMSKGHEIIVRDLYAMNFNPVLSSQDFVGLRAKNLPEDIKREQEYIKWADVITFIYPIWWTGMPALIKGYVDRIFLNGFAYAVNQNGTIKLLTDKKAVVLSTHGQPKSVYEGEYYNALETTFDKGIMNFCGIEVINHTYFPSVRTANEETIKEYLNTVKEIALKF